MVFVFQPCFWVLLELTPAANPFLPQLWHLGLLCDVFINLVHGMGFPAGKCIHWANISFLFPLLAASGSVQLLEKNNPQQLNLPKTWKQLGDPFLEKEDKIFQLPSRGINAHFSSQFDSLFKEQVFMLCAFIS